MFDVIPKFSYTVLIFKNVFSFSDWVISIILSSRSLMHSLISVVEMWFSANRCWKIYRFVLFKNMLWVVSTWLLSQILGKALLEMANWTNKGNNCNLLKSPNVKCPEGRMCVVSSRNRKKKKKNSVARK